MDEDPDAAAPAAPPRSPPASPPTGRPRRRPAITAAGLLLLAAAAALAPRTCRLDARPFHCDEAVQAVKTGELYDGGRYRYDPFEFHGPSLYYLTLPVLKLRGARSFAEARDADFRLVPALFGAGLILLLLPLARGLGPTATSTAAVLTAVSPAMVYFSRYYIQEMLLVGFAALALGALWHCHLSPRRRWRVLLGLALGLMFATKETSVVFCAALAAACAPLALARHRHRHSAGPHSPPRHPIRNALLVAATAAAVAALFYSSFLTHPRGPLDSLLAFTHYLDRSGGSGSAAHHRHPWHYYLHLLLYTKNAPGPWWSEALILALAATGLAATALRRLPPAVNPTLAASLATYTLCLTAAFSLIPYKTPWNLLGFLHAMILVAGIGTAWILHRLPWRPARAAVVLLLAAATTHLAAQAWRACFRFGADPRNPYAYAHSVPDAPRLARRIADLAAIHPDGRSMPVHFITPEYWPLPYYLRQLDHVGYWHEIPAAPDAPVVVAATDLQERLEPLLRHPYAAEFYGLRPGVLLVCYVRQDLWQRYLERQRANHERPAPPPE